MNKKILAIFLILIVVSSNFSGLVYAQTAKISKNRIIICSENASKIYNRYGHWCIVSGVENFDFSIDVKNSEIFTAQIFSPGLSLNTVSSNNAKFSFIGNTSIPFIVYTNSEDSLLSVTGDAEIYYQDATAMVSLIFATYSYKVFDDLNKVSSKFLKFNNAVHDLAVSKSSSELNLEGIKKEFNTNIKSKIYFSSVSESKIYFQGGTPTVYSDEEFKITDTARAKLQNLLAGQTTEYLVMFIYDGDTIVDVRTQPLVRIPGQYFNFDGTGAMMWAVREAPNVDPSYQISIGHFHPDSSISGFTYGGYPWQFSGTDLDTVRGMPVRQIPGYFIGDNAIGRNPGGYKIVTRGGVEYYTSPIVVDFGNGDVRVYNEYLPVSGTPEERVNDYTRNIDGRVTQITNEVPSVIVSANTIDGLLEETHNINAENLRKLFSSTDQTDLASIRDSMRGDLETWKSFYEAQKSNMADVNLRASIEKMIRELEDAQTRINSASTWDEMVREISNREQNVALTETAIVDHEVMLEALRTGETVSDLITPRMNALLEAQRLLRTDIFDSYRTLLTENPDMWNNPEAVAVLKDTIKSFRDNYARLLDTIGVNPDNPLYHSLNDELRDLNLFLENVDKMSYQDAIDNLRSLSENARATIDSTTADYANAANRGVRDEANARNGVDSAGYEVDINGVRADLSESLRSVENWRQYYEFIGDEKAVINIDELIARYHETLDQLSRANNPEEVRGLSDSLRADFDSTVREVTPSRFQNIRDTFSDFADSLANADLTRNFDITSSAVETLRDNLLNIAQVEQWQSIRNTWSTINDWRSGRIDTEEFVNTVEDLQGPLPGLTEYTRLGGELALWVLWGELGDIAISELGFHLGSSAATNPIYGVSSAVWTVTKVGVGAYFTYQIALSVAASYTQVAAAMIAGGVVAGVATGVATLGVPFALMYIGSLAGGIMSYYHTASIETRLYERYRNLATDLYMQAEEARRQGNNDLANQLQQQADQATNVANQHLAAAGEAQAAAVRTTGALAITASTAAIFALYGAAIGSVVPGIGTAIGAAVGFVVGTVVGAISSAVSPSTATAVGNAVTSAATAVANAVTSAATAVANAVTSAATAVANAVTSAVNAVSNAISSLFG